MIEQSYSPVSKKCQSSYTYTTTYRGNQNNYPVSNYTKPQQQQNNNLHGVSIRSAPGGHPGRSNADYDAYAATRAANLGITPDEWKRRDAIVGEEYAACVFNTGDTFYPYTYAEYLLRGKCMIFSKVAVYSQMERDEWPANDCPMIIHAKSLQNNSTFFCTVGYMVKQEPQKTE